MSWKNQVLDSEMYTYDYFFLDYVCRLCWCQNGVKEITSFSTNESKKDTTIAEKILNCIGVDINANSYPKKVCESCLNEIEHFSEFKLFCLQSDSKLQEILQRGPLIIENNEISPKFDEIYETNDKDLKLELDSVDDLFGLNYESDTGRIETKTKSKKVRKKAETYCTSCRYDLENLDNLVQHNIEYHGFENGLFKCFGCEKTFKQKNKRLRHELASCKALKNGYECVICKRFLPKRSMYESHLRAHKNNEDVNLPEELFKCKKCLKTFKNKQLLDNHECDCAREKKNWICDICGRVFSRCDYLNKHKFIHNGIKQHKCPHCDFSTIQRSSLTVHFRKHTGERPYSCDLCPLRCVTSSNLREHRKRHLGIKQFECKLCDKKFGYKISLEEHMSSIHERSEVYSCEQCGATYTRFRGLRRHLAAKHGKVITKKRISDLEHNTEIK